MGCKFSCKNIVSIKKQGTLVTYHVVSYVEKMGNKIHFTANRRYGRWGGGLIYWKIK